MRGAALLLALAAASIGCAVRPAPDAPGCTLIAIHGPGHDWFDANEPIQLGSRRYLKYGSPRPVPPDSIRWFTLHGGVPVFADTAAVWTPSHLLYVQVSSACVFQPYTQQLGPAPVVDG